MRKPILVLVCLLIVLSVMACSSTKTTTQAPTTQTSPATTASTTVATAPVYTLRFAGMFPSTGTVGQYILAVEKLATDRSNGRLQFINYWNSSLLTMDQFVPGLSKDIVDLAYTTFDQVVPLMPYSQATQVRGVVYNTWAAMMACTEFDKIPQIAIEWAKQNVVLEWASVAPPAKVLATKPARTFADLTGMKLQTSGESGNNLAKNCGIIPIAMGTGDIYDAVSKGTLDGVIYCPEYYSMYKWLEVCKYIMWDADYTGMENQIGFNLKTLNSLPPDLRKIITDIGDSGASADLFQKIVCIDAKQSLITKDAPAAKVEMVRWSQADIDKLNQIVSKEKDAWVTSMTSRGFADAAIVFNKWVELYNKYVALYPAKAQAMGWGSY